MGGHEPVHVAVVVVVADRGAHACLVDDHVGVGPRREGPVAVVEQDLAAIEVRHHQQVTVAVVVNVAQVRGEGPILAALDDRRGNAGLDAGTGEREIAVVPPHRLGVFAELPVGAPMGEEQVEVAVAVVVVERGGHRVLRSDRDSGTGRHVHEDTRGGVGGVEPVLEQVDRIAVARTHEEVEVAVAVDVAERRAASPMGDVETDARRHFHVGAVALVLVEVVGLGAPADDV